MPVRQPDFQQQDRQLDQEQHQHHNQQQQQHARPPLVSTPSVPSSPPPSRSPDRSSAPANLYSRVAEEDDDDDDDRPLASQRDSYPPHRPIPVASYPKKELAFEVTSRGASREKPSLAQDGAWVPDSRPVAHRRNTSGGESTSSSFDSGEIYDAYSAVSPDRSPPAGFATELNIAPSLAVLGTVAPRLAERRRGDSLAGRPDAGGGELVEPPSPPPGRNGKEGRLEMRRRQQTMPVGGEVRSTREYR